MESTRWDSAPSSSDSGCDGFGCDDGDGLRDSWIRYIPTLTSSSSSSSLDGVSNETLALGERPCALSVSCLGERPLVPHLHPWYSLIVCRESAVLHLFFPVPPP